eukprot:CAMPEP_0119416194 /NCGR_PEP_ID=MMETSP1335-20130426/11990_1 /TAXON_ID=259385 /ORGANISM="Chrysoculter rhomboideus, Strain RCC1486" /LENGTH=311 /DNA_ID=CAMNT_0007441297 /DNA_START=97 /DNA_END=1030 /DNA_ORIENTATION=-
MTRAILAAVREQRLALATVSSCEPVLVDCGQVYERLIRIELSKVVELDAAGIALHARRPRASRRGRSLLARVVARAEDRARLRAVAVLGVRHADWDPSCLRTADVQRRAAAGHGAAEHRAARRAAQRARGHPALVAHVLDAGDAQQPRRVLEARLRNAQRARDVRPAVQPSRLERAARPRAEHALRQAQLVRARRARLAEPPRAAAGGCGRPSSRAPVAVCVHTHAACGALVQRRARGVGAAERGAHCALVLRRAERERVRASSRAALALVLAKASCGTVASLGRLALHVRARAGQRQLVERPEQRVEEQR